MTTTETTQTTRNTATFVNRLLPSLKTRKEYRYALVSVGPEGVEQEIARFKYASDVVTAGQAIAAAPCPPGEWQVIARNI